MYKHYRNSLITARNVGQGNIFRSMCQEFCSGGVIPACLAGGIPACLCRSPGPHPEGSLRGLAGGLQAHTRGGRLRGLARGGVSRTTAGGGGVSRPTPGGLQAHTQGEGCVSKHALRQTPSTHTAGGYCCGRYASYWNAFLFCIIIHIS